MIYIEIHSFNLEILLSEKFLFYFFEALLNHGLRPIKVFTIEFAKLTVATRPDQGAGVSE